jgi:hypothetical protein
MKSRSASTTRLWIPVESGSIRQMLIEARGRPEKPVPHYPSELPLSSKAESTPESWPELPELQDTLVAGVFLEKILPVGLSSDYDQISSQIKKALVEKLAGHITLNKFRQLMKHVDDLIPRLLRVWRPAQDSGARPSHSSKPSIPPKTSPDDAPGTETGTTQAAETNQPGESLQSPEEIQPRKEAWVSLADLRKFFSTLNNEEFRLKDFENFFQVNKTTAFLCVKALVRKGVLNHNGEKTVRVRYTPVSGWDRGAPANF